MAKKKRNKRKPSKVYALYEKDGKMKSKFCPKCGQGTYMAKHKNRYTCGKCKYTEFEKKG